MTDEAELAQVKSQAALASAEGIRGVPFFILDARLQLSGAQPSATLETAIERALAVD